jgi:peroxiredoxin
VRIRNRFPIVSVLFLAAAMFNSGAMLVEPPSAYGARDDLFKKMAINRVDDNSPAPDFTLRDLNSNLVSLNRFRGSVVFLNFWATWCGPCRQEMPSMEHLYRRLGGRGLAMLAVSKRESRNQVAVFMRNYGLSFPALLDVDGRVSSLYNVWALPKTFVIDARGRMIGATSGSRDWNSGHAVELFRNLIEESGPGVSAAIDPPAPFPASLVVGTRGATVHTQQDQHSEAITELEKGEPLFPLAKTFGGGGEWYMVKTRKGTVGWIKASNVEEAQR